MTYSRVPRILVVEDNLDLQILLTEVLAHDYEVASATSGEDAVVLASGATADGTGWTGTLRNDATGQVQAKVNVVCMDGVNEDEVVEKFKDFLDEVSPEDFAGGE